MKKIVFTILFATLFVACNNVTGEDNPVISPNLEIQEEQIFNDNKTFTIGIFETNFITILNVNRIKEVNITAGIILIAFVKL